VLINVFILNLQIILVWQYVFIYMDGVLIISTNMNDDDDTKKYLTSKVQNKRFKWGRYNFGYQNKKTQWEEKTQWEDLFFVNLIILRKS
jgi:hypothetical protein